MSKAEKPTLLNLRLQTSLTTEQVAKEAGVRHTEAYIVEIGGFVERELAEKVLLAFSKLSGTSYTLDDICYQNVAHLRPPPKESRKQMQ